MQLYNPKKSPNHLLVETEIVFKQVSVHPSTLVLLPQEVLLDMLWRHVLDDRPLVKSYLVKF